MLNAETHSQHKNMLNSDVTFVFMSSFVREYTGRGYVQKSLHTAVICWNLQLLYHCFTTAVESYLRDCCGIVTFDVELQWSFL